MNSVISRDGKLPKPRQLDLSHYGTLCAAETPEGKSVGLVNHQACLNRIRVGTPGRFIIDLLREDLKVDRQVSRFPTLVLVNGIICGSVQDPNQLVKDFRRYRRSFSVPIDSSVAYRRGEVSILCDGEDCYRPVLNLERLRAHFGRLWSLYSESLHLFWTELLLAGVIDYVNKEEEETLVIGCGYEGEDLSKCSHVELSAAMTLYGVSAACIPLSDRDQAPRIIYQIVVSQTRNTANTPPNCTKDLPDQTDTKLTQTSKDTKSSLIKKNKLSELLPRIKEC